MSGKIVRFHADGIADASFGDGGFVQTQGFIGLPNLAVQGDDKILFSVSSIVWRLLPNGSPDSSIGNAGTTSLSTPANGTTITTVLPQKDGTILVGGSTPASEALNVQFLIGRFLPNGTPDPAFDTDGWNAVTFPSFLNSEVRSLLVQADGRVVAVGEAMTLNTGIALARFHPNGALDTEFGTGGLVTSTSEFLPVYVGGATLLPAGEIQVYSPGRLLRYQTGLFPGINVSQPTGTPLRHAASSPQDFGLIPVGSRTKEFTITNWAATPLAGLAVSLADEGNTTDFTFSQPAVTILATGQSTTFFVTFTPTQSGPRTATLRIASNDPVYNPFLISLTGRRSTPLETWRITWFGSPDNSGPGADLNDFDHDGLPNLLEFAAGSHPHQPSPPVGVPALSSDSLTFTWTHPIGALTDVVYQVESASVPSGPWSSTGITTAVLTADAISQTLQATIPTAAAGGNRQFVRLRVTRR